MTKLDAKEFKNLKKLERLILRDNKGTISAEMNDERNACDCGQLTCKLPSSIRKDDDRAPTCFLE